MVKKIKISSSAVALGAYKERKTKTGYSGKITKRKAGHDLPIQATELEATDTDSQKRARLESYTTPCNDETTVDFSPDVSPLSNPADLPSTAEPYREDVFSHRNGKSGQGKTSHEYMEEWKREKVVAYLDRILEAEARRNYTCEQCRQAEAMWRCLDCLAAPRSCVQCCRVAHRRLPFHRIERWTGTHWTPAWLWHVGTIICLGHCGDACPSYNATMEELEARCITTNEVDALDDDHTFGAKPKKVTSLGTGRIVSYVHLNGFHYLPTFPCWCPNALSDDIQFLDLNFYPASFQTVSTVFTFDLLDKFHLFKVDSHMSTDQFNALLRRFTNSLFPDKTLDRRRELARAWLQWNYLLELRRNGFGHSHRGEVPKKGQLAVVCPVCPQPEINLPANWKEDPNSWLYRRYLAVDGNFQLDHLASNKSQGVPLVGGAAFMAEPTRFAKHLQHAKEEDEPATCSELRAVEEKNKTKKGYDATGIIGVACARHGFFAPGAVVDMQKGERQVNVDYAFCEAIKTTRADQTNGVILAYDINCQYSINLHKRINLGRYLSYPPNLPLDFVIGLFHVHGHKDECLARFAPTFLPGVGITSGEILESLWSTTNGASRITRNMTIWNRWETLNACMQDSNIRKTQGLPALLQKHLKNAEHELIEAMIAFSSASKGTSPEQRTLWEAQMRDAVAGRGGHNTSMDVYNIRVPQVEPKKAVQLRLMRREKEREKDVGVAKWIGTGIAIQDSQLSLRSQYRSRNSLSLAESVELETKAQALIKRINGFFRTAKKLFPYLDLTDHIGEQWESDSIEVCVCEEDCACKELAELPMGRVVFDASSAEFTPLPLPSSFDTIPKGWAVAVETEIRLRVAQAEEELEDLRGEIGEKSYLYRAKRALAGGGRGITRSYDGINKIESSMRSHVEKYENARWALRRLGVADKYPRFRPIDRSDTKAVTAVFDPNKAGERHATLSWIWTMNVQGDSATDEYLAEVFRVNWIRARSRLDRWREEIIQIECEMAWFQNFMTYQQGRARQWAQLGLGDGHQAYALRQADMWRRLGLNAATRFYQVPEGPLQEGESVVISQTTSGSTNDRGDEDAGGVNGEFDEGEPIE